MAKKAKKVATAEEIKEVALGTILDVLKGDKDFDNKTQLAMKYLNYQNRQEHQQQTKAKFRFTLVKSLADPEIMKRYIVSSEPSIKKLPA
ncbi:hypothetical protein LCGC14_1881540 [marine sediment metagenome]|uniref:Uncharacterized protein n=1 Tax=marine sediment metagenome TaxID=412755 RepID=A0A0F9IG62_9ZZZZ